MAGQFARQRGNEMQGTKKTITLRRKADRIDFVSTSGATVAYLLDTEHAIRYDPLADTDEAFGLINFRTVIAAAGLNADVARDIVAAGQRYGRM